MSLEEHNNAGPTGHLPYRVHSAITRKPGLKNLIQLRNVCDWPIVLIKPKGYKRVMPGNSVIDISGGPGFVFFEFACGPVGPVKKMIASYGCTVELAVMDP